MKTLSDHITDIIQNSIRAEATLIKISIEEDNNNDLCFVRIKDNGYGMDEETLRHAVDPFFTSRKTRKVGLGLSLLKQNADGANGTFEIKSEKGKGTEVKAGFQFSHFDKPPLGEIWDTFYLAMLGNDDIDISYRHKTNKGSFEFHSAEIKQILGEISIMQKEMKKAITDMIKNNLENIESKN